MKRIILQCEEKFCCDVNDFLNSNKKILFIKCKNAENCKMLIHSTETAEYIFTDLFYNVSQPEQLLFLLRQQRNPNKIPAEYNLFLGYGNNSSSFSYGINPVGIINSIRNLFKKDLSTIKDQFVDCLKKLKKEIAVLLYVKDDITKQLLSLIVELCSDENCFAKFVFVHKNSISNNLLHLRKKFSGLVKEINLCYDAKQIKSFFPLFSVEQVQDMLVATDEDIDEMILIYNQVFRNNNTCVSGYVNSLIRSSLGQTFDEYSKKILGVAAHLFTKFSVDELCEICNKAFINNSYEIIDEVLEKNCKNGIIDVSDAEYVFLSKNIKKAFADMFSRISKRLHTVIYEYLAKNKPFEYTLRRLHAKLAQERENEINMIAMELCNACHFFKQPNKSILQDFQNTFGDSITNALLSTYKNILEGNYIEARKNCLILSVSENLVLQQEMKYLCALIDWKIGDMQRYIIIQNSLTELINSKTSEEEMIILAEMLQLSVVSNIGEYARRPNQTTPYTIFNSINKKLSRLKCLDSDFLKHVLYRKSNSAQPRALALKYVGESFEYFKDRKELYYEEYLEAGVNLLAMQLESIDKDSINFPGKTEVYGNPYTFAINIAGAYETCQSENIKVYFKNNYLIAKMFFDQKSLTAEELEKFYFETKYVNLDSQIMFTMNVGTFFAYFHEYDKARIFWEKAKNLNEANDDYFNYIISSNQLILNICEGKNSGNLNLMIPALFCNDAELCQYIEERNNLIKQLLSNESPIPHETLQKIFSTRFEEKFQGGNLLFYSIPFLFSDVQFWSEN